MGSERGCKHPDSGEMVVIDQPRIVIITVYKGVCQIRQLLHQAFQYIGAAYSQRQQASQIRIGLLKRRPYQIQISGQHIKLMVVFRQKLNGLS